MGISKHPIREEKMGVNTYFLIQYANSEIVRMEWLRGRREVLELRAGRTREERGKLRVGAKAKEARLDVRF